MNLICDPDGEQKCIYMKNEKKFFELTCECGLDLQKGYCPIPKDTDIKEYNKWIQKMWLGDNCHTYDRNSLKAQKECGIGLNGKVLENVAIQKMKIEFYPM